MLDIAVIAADYKVMRPWMKMEPCFVCWEYQNLFP